MIWSSVFIAGIAQGLFLISLIHRKSSRNRTAMWLICGLLSVMVLTNLGYLAARTELANYVPQLFGLPFGMVLLMGPLLYLYSLSVTDPSFQWKPHFIFHFFPYFFQLLLNLPFLLAPRYFWTEFIQLFLSGNSPVFFSQKVIFTLQNVHLLIYLVLTFMWIRRIQKRQNKIPYLISIADRTSWLKVLAYCFVAFFVVVFSATVYVMISSFYNPVTNYSYTMVTSVIVYLIAVKLVVRPEVLSPDFIQKYKTYMQFAGEDGDKYFNKVKALMSDTKIYINPDLNLASLAESLGLPSHQVSKLVNEKFGMSFNDMVNEYRVREFIARINDPAYKAYSVLGVAMEVGFNSKSSFNNAFKKITGKTPSDFRKEV